MNRKTRNGEPQIGPDGSSQTWQNSRVDWYGAGFGPPRSSRSGFCTVQEPNRTVFPAQARTAGGLPGPIANSTYMTSLTNILLLNVVFNFMFAFSLDLDGQDVI